MKSSLSGNPILGVIKSNIIYIILFLVVTFIFIGGLSSAAKAEEREALVVAETSIRRAVVSCYAVEGRYPETYDYLKENYGVRINEDKYAVHYEIFASNIMPQITVVVK